MLRLIVYLPRHWPALHTAPCGPRLPNQGKRGSCAVTRATGEFRFPRCSALYQVGFCRSSGGGRRLKLAPPPLPGGPCALSCVHTCEGSSVSSEPIKIPSNILLWLLSSRGKQQLAAAKLNGAPELGLEASMLHLHTTALLQTLA